MCLIKISLVKRSIALFNLSRASDSSSTLAIAVQRASARGHHRCSRNVSEYILQSPPYVTQHPLREHSCMPLQRFLDMPTILSAAMYICLPIYLASCLSVSLSLSITLSLSLSFARYIATSHSIAHRVSVVLSPSLSLELSLYISLSHMISKGLSVVFQLPIRVSSMPLQCTLRHFQIAIQMQFKGQSNALHRKDPHKLFKCGSNAVNNMSLQLLLNNLQRYLNLLAHVQAETAH